MSDFHRANKNPLGEWLITRLLMERGLRRAFGGVYVRVKPETLQLTHADMPVIFCATHSGWWDGHMASIVNRKVFHHDAYLMMEEISLERYWFFTWAGVFGIDRHDPRKALASIEYITGLLSSRRRAALWMFPQGTMSHPEARPLNMYGGVANIARRLNRCAIVPVALRYDFLLEQAPDAFALLGAPLVLDLQKERVTSKEISGRLLASMTQVADELRAGVIAYNPEPYRRILAGRSSSNHAWDALASTVSRSKNVVGKLFRR